MASDAPLKRSILSTNPLYPSNSLFENGSPRTQSASFVKVESVGVEAPVESVAPLPAVEELGEHAEMCMTSLTSANQNMGSDNDGLESEQVGGSLAHARVPVTHILIFPFTLSLITTYSPNHLTHEPILIFRRSLFLSLYRPASLFQYMTCSHGHP